MVWHGIISPPSLLYFTLHRLPNPNPKVIFGPPTGGILNPKIIAKTANVDWICFTVLEYVHLHGLWIPWESHAHVRPVVAPDEVHQVTHFDQVMYAMT